MEKITIEEIYRKIVDEDKSFIEVYNSGIPLYERISYPLTSLEVLFSSKYAQMMRLEEAKSDIILIKELDKNMARYQINYVNENIKLLSEVSQKWIDYNFSVMYTLKGLFKTALGESRKEIFNFMSEAKSIDHFLLNLLIYEFIPQEENTNLISFLSEHNVKVADIEDILNTDLITKMNFWQDKVMSKLIDRINKSLLNNLISDTQDGKLQKSVNDWNNNKGNWRNIN